MTQPIHNEETKERLVIEALTKVLAKPEKIVHTCDNCAKLAQKLAKADKLEQRTAQIIMEHYSNLTAMGGGLSAVPGTIPGIGTILSLFGAGAIDAFLALKYEIEMSLALSHLAGFDIRDPREQKLACLLACSALEDAYSSESEPTMGNVLDLAMSNYSTRELCKTLAKALARVLMMVAAKKWTRFFPLVGIGIEMGVNKLLCERLGREIWKAIRHRRESQPSSVPACRNAQNCD